MRMYSSSPKHKPQNAIHMLGAALAQQATLVYSFGSLARKENIGNMPSARHSTHQTDRSTLPYNKYFVLRDHIIARNHHASRLTLATLFHFPHQMENSPLACLTKRRTHREIHSHSLSFSIFHSHWHRRDFRRPCRAYRPCLPFHQLRT